MKKKFLALTLALSLLLALTACSSRPSAQEVTEAAIQAFQTMDAESMSQYWTGDEWEETFGDTDEATLTQIELFAQNLTYEVVEAVEDEDAGTATVTVAFTNLDMEPIMAQFLEVAIAEAFAYAFSEDGQMPSDEELEARYTEILTEAMSAEDAALTTITADVPLTLVDDQWVMDANDQVLNAMLGGLMDIADELEALSLE